MSSIGARCAVALVGVVALVVGCERPTDRGQPPDDFTPTTSPVGGPAQLATGTVASAAGWPELIRLATRRGARYTQTELAGAFDRLEKLVNSVGGLSPGEARELVFLRYSIAGAGARAVPMLQEALDRAPDGIGREMALGIISQITDDRVVASVSAVPVERLSPDELRSVFNACRFNPEAPDAAVLANRAMAVADGDLRSYGTETLEMLRAPPR